jgi:8-oxo-dGTP pyrophosphatase MutT (NUDIX family)
MDLLKQIRNYEPYNEQEKKDKEVFIKYLTEFENSLERENEYGHVCSAAFVLNEDRDKLLMIHHNIYNSWGWLGGHADGDDDLLHVAVKEVKEESGLQKINPISKDIFIVDTLPVLGHEKRGKYVPAHVHLNVAYVLEGSEEEELTINERENSGVKWVNIDDMVKLSAEPFMQYVYGKAVEKMKEEEIID